MMWVLRLASATTVFAVVLTESFAQTPDQLAQLNALTPDQRELLLNTLDPQRMGTPISPVATTSDPQLTFPEVVGPAAITEPLGVPQGGHRFVGGDTLVIEFAAAEAEAEAEAEVEAEDPGTGQDNIAEPILNQSELERIQQLAQLIEHLTAGNPYELDSVGYLYLPGVRRMLLAGLNVDEAAIRIRVESALAEVALAGWVPTVTFLPLQPVGVAALVPFGYDLFSGAPTTFAPATDVPVPSDYVMGPGDTVNVQLFGGENVEYSLVVSREGTINFPEIGPISVGGLTFVELQEVVTQRVAAAMPVARSNVTLGELRSIRIFVLGDVERAGSYTVSGFTTMTNALFVSGGITEVGSLRQIELKRDGQTISTLDLYDLLLRGDTSADERLQPGDVIFAPPVGNTASIDGGVRRPAIYELIEENTVDTLVELAGGFLPNADLSSLKLERIVPGRGVTVHDLDLTGQLGGSETLQDGDVVQVPLNLDQFEGAVQLSGNVFQPGLYQWVEGMTLTDLIGSPELVKPESDLSYVLIRREIEPNVFVEAFSTDLRAAWRQPKGIEDLNLQPRDTVNVFNLGIGREAIVAPLISELRAQASQNEPVSVVSIGGEVRDPGDYPLEPGMTIMDLIRAGGGLTEAAYLGDAELTRLENISGESRDMRILSVNLAAAMAGDTAPDFSLKPNDYLGVRALPSSDFGGTIELEGEVLFPGTYSFQQGETLFSVLTRAGGLTDQAFVDGSVFLREDIVEREQEQLRDLAVRVESDMAAAAMTASAQGGDSEAVLEAGQALVNRILNTVPTGRLSIRLNQIVAGDQNVDISLKAGDVLLVPETSQEITVMGEVQYATSHMYQGNLERDDYINLSGGLTPQGDDQRIYVVRANGEVSIRQRSRWFVGRQGVGEIRPGDTVVVPTSPPVAGLELWAGVTQIMYNLAISAAAVASF